ncbi:MAG TPA: adenylate/guanylate cyclase domain-containing protein [Burkholderiales bacterium]
MVESTSRTLVCSVLFLDIAEYTRKPVAEQLQLKQAFNRILGEALEQVAPRDRIILDTGDGAAVTFMGDPEDALFSAMAMRDMCGTVPVRLGVNLGPVRLVKDLNGQMNIIGDGINVAQRVMSFSRPSQLLVSRSFYEVVSCLSRDYANLFHHEGSRTDKHVREHEVYSVVGGTPSVRRVPETESKFSALAYGSGWLAGPGPLGLRRSSLAAAPLLFLLLIGVGMTARAVMGSGDSELAAPAPKKAAPKVASAPPAAPAPAAKPLAEAPKPKPEAAKPRAPVESKPVAKAERKAPPKPVVVASAPAAPPAAAAPAAPGRIELAVNPWGEVFVNGKSRGVSPPLRTLEIPPGSHTIEIRNSTFPSHTEKVEVKPGDAVKIRHRFR